MTKSAPILHSNLRLLFCTGFHLILYEISLLVSLAHRIQLLRDGIAGDFAAIAPNRHGPSCRLVCEVTTRIVGIGSINLAGVVGDCSTETETK